MSNRYKLWKQGEKRFNMEMAWPPWDYPMADFYYFKECGCLICALATLLCQNLLISQEALPQFNPWVLNEQLKLSNMFDSAADLELEKISNLYPLEYYGTVPYARPLLLSLLAETYLCLLTVPGVLGKFHYIAIDYITDEDIFIIDSAFGKNKLSEFDRALGILKFKKHTKE